MPKIDFCFSGWLRGVNIDHVTDAEGNSIDVSSLTSEELIERLESGKLFISLSGSLNCSNEDEEVEIFDYSF
jgi:hypothetical protein